MKAWKVILVALVIFVAGGFAGAATNRIVQHRRALPRNQAGAPPWIAQRMELLRLMQRELNLTREQNDQLRHILEESRDRMNREWRQETQKVREEMGRILTPDQRRRLQEAQKNRGNRRPEGGLREERRPESQRFRNGPNPNESNPPRQPARPIPEQKRPTETAPPSRDRQTP